MLASPAIFPNVLHDLFDVRGLPKGVATLGVEPEEDESILLLGAVGVDPCRIWN